VGFYLRKSFRMGPVRLNLSKSGLGMSAGVRGARLGISSTGRSYVHAGRGGLYLRRYLDSSTASGRKARQLRATSEPIILNEDTDVTFPSSQVPHSTSHLESKVVRRKKRVAIYLLMPLAGLLVAGVTAGKGFTGVAAALTTVISLVLLLLWPLPMWKAWRKNRAGSKLGVLLKDSLSSGRPLALRQLEVISIALADPRLTSDDRKYQCSRAYLELVLTLVEDRRVLDEELQLLRKVEEIFQLPWEFVQEARADAFRDAYLEAIADKELTEDEEQALVHIRDAFKIPESALESELNVVRQLREVRVIRQGKLPVFDPSKPLQKSEVCHYEAPARILKEKNLRSFQSEGQKYKVRGLIIDKEGTLFVTSKRLLIVHQGTTTIPLDRIIDLEVDYDQSLLTITKDGVRAPVLLTTPDVMKAGAILAAAANL
jgi:hypothetical protein